MGLSFKQQGRRSNGVRALAPRAAAEDVVIEVDVPHPAIELKLSFGTDTSPFLRELAKKVKLNNERVWWYGGEPDHKWTTIHSLSEPTAPRLTCDPLDAIRETKKIFDRSPLVNPSSFRSRPAASRFSKPSVRSPEP